MASAADLVGTAPETRHPDGRGAGRIHAARPPDGAAPPRYPGEGFTSRHVSLELPPEVVRDLARRYAEPHRAYHTAEHIAEVLRWFDWAAERTGWHDPVDVYLAIVFHDAIYDPLAVDNEARSAALARDAVAASQRTQALIQLTARHSK